MELLTNILIWAGILTAAVVVVLAIHEFVWKPRQEKSPVEGPDRTVRETAPAGEGVDESAVAAEPGPAVASEAPAKREMVARPGPESDEVVAAERFKTLTRSQRLGLARLTTMTASFDREAALAVAACKEGDFDAVAASGLIEQDEETGRYTITATGRALGAEHLTPEDAELVRQFHLEHFTRLVEAVQSSEVEDREAAVVGFELVQTEWPHLEVVLERLQTREDGDLFLQFAEAVNATGLFQTRIEDGLKWYGLMVEAARKLGDREKELNAVTSLGSIHAQLGRHQEALDDYTCGAVLSRELQERHSEGSCMGNMGLAYQHLGEEAKAEECFKEVLDIMREVGDHVREGFALASLGRVAGSRGDTARAIELHEEHLKLNLEHGDARGEMLALALLGETYMASGQLSDAVDRFERQLKIAKTLDDMPAEGNALGHLGAACRQLGQPDKGAEYFGRQIDIAHTLADSATGLHAMGQLGECHQEANRTWKAVECFDDQLKLARQLGDQETEAQALWSAARAVRSLGRLPDAITRVSAALAILESIGSPEAAKAKADLESWRSSKG